MSIASCLVIALVAGLLWVLYLANVWRDRYEDECQENERLRKLMSIFGISERLMRLVPLRGGRERGMHDAE